MLVGTRAVDVEQGIWKLLAFVCRYGHQPVKDLMRMTLRDVRCLADELGNLLEQEAPEQSLVNDR